MSRFLYVAACLVVPLVWGVVVYLVTRRLETRFPRKPPARPDIDYLI